MQHAHQVGVPFLRARRGGQGASEAAGEVGERAGQGRRAGSISTKPIAGTLRKTKNINKKKALNFFKNNINKF